MGEAPRRAPAPGPLSDEIDAGRGAAIGSPGIQRLARRSALRLRPDTADLEFPLAHRARDAGPLAVPGFLPGWLDQPTPRPGRYGHDARRRKARSRQRGAAPRDR